MPQSGLSIRAGADEKERIRIASMFRGLIPDLDFLEVFHERVNRQGPCFICGNTHAFIIKAQCYEHTVAEYMPLNSVQVEWDCQECGVVQAFIRKDIFLTNSKWEKE